MIVRWRSPRILPIEIWDIHVPFPEGLRPLYEFLDDEGRARALPRAIESLRSGRATAWSGTIFPTLCGSIDRVAIGGGGATPNIERALAAFHCITVERGPFLGTPGGLHIGGANATIVDVGQSSIKLSAGHFRACIPRDRTTIPNADSLAPADRPAARERTIDYLASCLRSLPEIPTTLVLALPCEIAADGTLDSCSYPWRRGDSTLVSETLARAGLAEVPTLLLNDAELAGASALLDPRIPDQSTTLVLTIGSGIGAALLLPKVV